MPDLQSELSKIASAWDTHEQQIRQPQQEKTMQQVTGNASRDTFEFIKLNPRKHTHAEAVRAIVQLGYKSNTVHSLITQMKRAGLVHADAGDLLYTEKTVYVPFTNPYKASLAKSKAQAEVKAKAKAKDKPQKAGIAALPVQAAEAPVERKQLVLKMTADDVLNKLDVKEAFKLYQELAKMFGG